jgi:hypothetical protein
MAVTLHGVKTLEQRWIAWKARREQGRAFRALGESLPASPEVAVQDEKLAGLDRALSLSLARDRADYAAIAPWLRLLVVLRGLFDRAVLRALRRRAMQARSLACERLGEASVDAAKGPAADAARAARDAVWQAEAQLEPLPVAVREAQQFSKFILKEARGQLVPRVPGLAGLGVGWWIAQTFTDSQFSATMHAWGLGEGPRHAVRSETLHAMSFWLPLLAAALASYAGSRLAALVRSRYSPPPDAVVSGDQLR